MEYACHMWGGSTHTALLDRVESEAFRLISAPPLINCVQPLKLRRNVASLSIFYHYFHANCFSDLTNCMPPLLLRPRCTRLASAAHPYSVQIPRARVNRHSQSFIPFTGKLRNSLPLSIFLPFLQLRFFQERSVKGPLKWPRLSYGISLLRSSV